MFFRSPTFSAAWHFLTGLATLRPGPVDKNAVALMIYAAIFVLTIDIVQRNTRDETPVIEWPGVARGFVFATLFVAIVLFSGGVAQPFFYFQF
jgi:hypothetical protein